MQENRSGNPCKPVLMLPDWRRGNPYQDRLAEGIVRQGVEVRFADYPVARLPLVAASKQLERPAVIHLHWVTDYLAPAFWARSPVWAWLRLTVIVLDVWLVRRSGIPVVWTVHNLLSHESPDRSREVRARRWLARAVSHLIFHSEAAREQVQGLLALDVRKKSSIVPHGHYLGMYPPNEQRERELRDLLRLRPDDSVVLFFGRIRRYKGVWRLVEALAMNPDPRLKLIIAGKPQDQDTAAELTRAAACDDRIRLQLGFVADKDVHPMHAISNLVAVPFEKTLTSGSAILALSMGRALLLPTAARVIGLPSDAGVHYFDDVEGLARAMSLGDKAQLETQGCRNLEIARDLDWGGIGASVARIYRRLLGPSRPFGGSERQ